MGAAPLGAQEVATWSVVTVLPGEGVDVLAERFKVTPEQLCAWNGLGPEEPEVGRRLKVLSVIGEVERFRLRVRVKKDTTWRRLARRYELPLSTLLALNRRKRGGKVSKGRLITTYVKKERWTRLYLDGGISLEARPGLVVKHPEWAWGRPVTVRTIEQVADRVDHRYPGSSMVAGDLSKRRGGRFPPHAGHRGGLDADLGLFVVDEPCTIRFRPLKRSRLDAERTWFMVRTFLETGRVERILLDWHLQGVLYNQARKEGLDDEKLESYFQYPRKKWKKKGTIRHHKGHRNHLHLRFREPEGEVIL